MKSKVFSKVVVMCMAVVMLFSVSFFGAGHCVMYDPRAGELQRRLEELEEENRILRLELRRFEAARELTEFFEGFDEDDYVWWNWGYIERYVEEGIEAVGEAESVGEIEDILASVKTSIHAVPIREWGYSECGRFAFSLSFWGYVIDENRDGWLENRGGRVSVIYHEFRNLTDEEFVIRGGFFYDMPWERWGFLRVCQYNPFNPWHGMSSLDLDWLFYWYADLYRSRTGLDLDPYLDFWHLIYFSHILNSLNRGTRVEKNANLSGNYAGHFTPLDENYISIKSYMAFYINYGEYNQERVEFASNLLRHYF